MPQLERIAPIRPEAVARDRWWRICGVLALAILRRIEEILKKRSGRDQFRLSDYFDYISGTSTGGIVAAGLSLGKSVDEILAFYKEASAQMFTKASLLRRLRYKFESEPVPIVN
jgi:patatin-like phospholipase/acyl hydrolase